MSTVEAIESLLPQTQCTRCEYPGCRPYAEAVLKGEAINRCAPGGTPTMQALASLLGRPPEPMPPTHTPFDGRAKQLAVIREEDCIGCTLCIKACPVDAIIGAPKAMHGIIEKDCTGCELCVPACPVNCIELTPLPGTQTWVIDNPEEQAAAQRAKQAHDAHLSRLAKQHAQKQRKTLQAEIQAAIARTKAKRAQHAPQNTSRPV